VDWNLVLPELIIVGGGLAVLLLDLFMSGSGRRSAGYFSLAVLTAALAAALRLGVPAGGEVAVGSLWQGMLVGDQFAVLFKVLFVVVGLVVVMLSVDFVERRGLPAGEFYALVLFAVLGMMLMAGSRDLIMIYLGLETTAIASYVLAGLLRGDAKSGEAAVKYFLTGALASAVILFGMSLIFGGVGSTSLGDIVFQVPTLAGLPARLAVASPGLLMVGLVLLVAGFGFKVAAVPFHFWAPDAYEGAPTPVTAFFSVGPKAAAFAVILRIFAPMLGWAEPDPGLGFLPVLFAVLAVITMTVGNLVALMQTNIKRMLAYSSIAHAGYILVGLAVASPRGFAAVIYYLIAYAAMNLGAFAVVIWLNNRGTGDDIDDYVGLSRRAPLAAAAMVVCFLSLIGIPPMAGFFGKFYLFMAAVESGLVWLAVVMVVNSAISVGYYYGVVRNMYLRAAGDEARAGAAGADGAAGSADAAGSSAAAGATAEAEAKGSDEPVPATPFVGTALAVAVVAVLAVGFLFEPLARLAGLAAGGF